LRRVAERVPERVAFQSSEPGAAAYTYREAFALAAAVGQMLAGAGMQLGDRVALWSRVSPSWAIAYLGILSSGGVVVPLDAGGGVADAAELVRATGSRVLIGSPDLLTPSNRSDLASSLDRLSILPLDALVRDATRTEASGTMRPVGETDLATIIFTSGTTGTPRGVVISHRSVSTTVLGMRGYMDLAPGDNVLALVPSHHVFAPVGNLLVPLVAGATITYAVITSSAELLRIVRDGGITVFPSVPQVFYALHRRIVDEVRRRPRAQRWLFFTMLRACAALRRRGVNAGRVVFKSVHQAMGGRLRVLVSGGSYCDPAVIRDLGALGFTFQQGYGMTETFGAGTLTPWREFVPGSVGVALPGMSVRVDNADEEGVGEIAVGGPAVMQGYLDDPEGTAAVLRDGWLRTGDSGYLDASGRLYVTGRRTDLIVLSSGKKVAPETLERHYAQSPAILEVCVMGVHDPSDYAGSERPHAVIVPDFDYLKAQGAVNSREVVRSEVERLSRELPPHLRVLSYEVRSTPLPRTATRKIIRWQVAAERTAPEGSGAAPRVRHEDDDALCRSEVGRRVLELVAEETRAPGPLDPSMNLELDLGVDSLQRIELIATVERAVGVRLPADSVSQCVTVRDLLRATARHVEAAHETTLRPQEHRRIRWRDLLCGPEVAQVDEPVLNAGPWMSAVQFAALKVIRLAAGVLFGFRVRGLENLPPAGAYLICPNHQSYLDGALVASAMPWPVVRRFVTLGWPAFFSGGVKTALARATNCVPIDPDTNLHRAMIVSAAALKRGKVVLIFPEGGLTWDGALQPFKKGPAILARELRVPIVPVGITGTFTVWPKGSSGPRRLGRVVLKIGKPIHVPSQPAPDEAGDAATERIAGRLREEVGALVGA
jgi:long-chain acyl-CoA synthetase